MQTVISSADQRFLLVAPLEPPAPPPPPPQHFMVERFNTPRLLDLICFGLQISRKKICFLEKLTAYLKLWHQREECRWFCEHSIRSTNTKAYKHKCCLKHFFSWNCNTLFKMRRISETLLFIKWRTRWFYGFTTVTGFLLPKRHTLFVCFYQD